MLLFFIFCCQHRAEQPIEQLMEQFQTLHRAVYDVYAMEQEPHKIHQLLEKSFVGEALTTEYIEHFTTLVNMEKEETAIDIMQVDYNSIAPLRYDENELVFDVDWSVGGIVTHQKHKHTRINRYRAVYTLHKEAGEWRIFDTKMRNMERIRRATDEDILNGTDAGGGYIDPLDLLDAGILETLAPKPEKKGETDD